MLASPPVRQSASPDTFLLTFSGIIMRYSLAALFAICALASNLALADNTITFEGEVNDQTCEANINGASDATVKLPSVSAVKLNKDGVFGKTAFNINVAGCDSNKKQKFSVKFFVEDPKHTTYGGNLSNISDTNPAENVAIQLSAGWGDLQVIKLQNNMGHSPEITMIKGIASESYQFFASYISESKTATPGHVKAVVIYELDYQ